MTHDPMYLYSQCAGAYLHDYRIRRTFHSCVEEVCRKCHNREWFPTRNGRSDNYNYLAHHIRQALSPRFPLYKHEYPKR